MKNLFLLIILGFITLYGFSINSVDPPAKTGDDVKTITPTSPSANDECIDLLKVVPVTVIVTFTDCPDYTCRAPGLFCTIEVCIYDFMYNLLECQPYDPDTCVYTFRLRANEGDPLYSHLNITPPGCMSGINIGYDQSSNTVPPGGGTVYINTKYCP